MRVTTAFNRLLALPGACVTDVLFGPDGVTKYAAGMPLLTGESTPPLSAGLWNRGLAYLAQGSSLATERGTP